MAESQSTSKASADPSVVAVAAMYAQSYLDAVGDRAPEADEELSSFVDDVLVPQPEFAQLFASQALNRDQRSQIIDRSIAPRASEHFVNFLRVLSEHERTDLLPVIREQFTLKREQREGRQRVTVRCARPLSEDSRNRISQRLKEVLGFDAILIEEVDNSLVGGIVLQVGDTVYDSSLRTRLKQLSGRLQERTLHEIQSGRDRFSHPEGD